MRRAASRLLSYFLLRLSLLVTSMAVLPAPYYQIPRFSGDTLTTGPGLSGFWSVPGGSEVIHMPDERRYGNRPTTVSWLPLTPQNQSVYTHYVVGGHCIAGLQRRALGGWLFDFAVI